MPSARPDILVPVLAGTLAALIAVPSSAAPARDAVRVFAAASLTEVVERLAEAFDDGPVATAFGSSSALARQIRDGAPADVFLSASPEWIEYLREADALDGEAIVLAHNRLVCIAPRGSSLAGRGIRDSATLLGALTEDERIAVADEGVPAGEYARHALAHVDLLDEFTPRLVGQPDVRAVLAAVERGELEAGFVYSTDARVADVDVLFAFDPASHPPIEYRAAVIRGAPHRDAARRFLAFLRADAARDILSAAGFAVPGNSE